MFYVWGIKVKVKVEKSECKRTPECTLKVLKYYLLWDTEKFGIGRCTSHFDRFIKKQNSQWVSNEIFKYYLNMSLCKKVLNNSMQFSN